MADDKEKSIQKALRKKKRAPRGASMRVGYSNFWDSLRSALLSAHEFC
jgi:hypothetical protein